MRVIGSFNNISDKLKEQVKQLKPKEYARFKILEVIKITDPDTKQTETRYPHKQLWARDSIFDPYLNDGEGGLVDIGVIAIGGVDIKNNIVTKVEQYEFNEHKTGIMVLDGSIAKDREIYEFLQLTNHLKDGVLGEHRDASVQELFVLMDSKKEAQQKNKQFALKRDAFVYIGNLDALEARDFAAGMNWDYEGDMDDIMARINAFADADPVKFNAECVNPLLKKKAIIRKAMGKMITYDPMNHAIKWSNGSVLATLERKPNQNEVEAFAEWLDTVANGDKILAQLRNVKRPAGATA